MTRTILSLVLVAAVSAGAAYKETMDPKGLTRNLEEYGLVADGGKSDQSAKLLQAINEVAEKGGGRLVIPKGTYAFSEVALRSNVHLLIEAGTVIKPMKSRKTGSGKWAFEAGRDKPVENVSIRGLGGRFTFSLDKYASRERVRCIALGDVTNFLISDIDVQDCFTTFSSIILTSPDGSQKTGFVGPTDGTIRDCSTFRASSGYGLVQAHAAKNVLFENLYARGGVAMRMECGVRPKNPKQRNGLFDIIGKNIKCEDGYVALLLGPHSTECGVLKVDGIEAVSCEFAVKITGGFISNRKKHEGDKVGFFARGTEISNIHAVYGEKAQLSAKHLRYLPEHLRGKVIPDEQNRMLIGPAITAVCDHSKNKDSNYDVIIRNVTTEGFRGIKPVITPADARDDEWVKEYGMKYRQQNWRDN